MRNIKIAFIVIIGWFFVAANLSLAFEPAMVLQLEGIAGDSPYEPYPDWIEILSFRHDITNKSSVNQLSIPGTQGGFTVTKYIDRSSPALNLCVSSGRLIPECTFVYLDGMGFMETYKFKKVLITTVSISAGSNERPIETISLHYQEIHWLLASYDPPFGTPSYSIESWWNVIKAKGDLVTFPPGTTDPPPTGFPPETRLFDWSLYY